MPLTMMIFPPVLGRSALATTFVLGSFTSEVDSEALNEADTEALVEAEVERLAEVLNDVGSTCAFRGTQEC